MAGQRLWPGVIKGGTNKRTNKGLSLVRRGRRRARCLHSPPLSTQFRIPPSTSTRSTIRSFPSTFLSSTASASRSVDRQTQRQYQLSGTATLTPRFSADSMQKCGRRLERCVCPLSRRSASWQDLKRAPSSCALALQRLHVYLFNL